jgi:hypothetical protein
MLLAALGHHYQVLHPFPAMQGVIKAFILIAVYQAIDRYIE